MTRPSLFLSKRMTFIPVKTGTPSSLSFFMNGIKMPWPVPSSVIRQRRAECPPLPVKSVRQTTPCFLVHSNVGAACSVTTLMCSGSPKPKPMRFISAASLAGESSMPCSFWTEEPGIAIMPPEREELPPATGIFSRTATFAPFSAAEMAAARPANPEPMTITSYSGANFCVCAKAIEGRAEQSAPDTIT